MALGQVQVSCCDAHGVFWKKLKKNDSQKKEKCNYKDKAALSSSAPLFFHHRASNLSLCGPSQNLIHKHRHYVLHTPGHNSIASSASMHSFTSRIKVEMSVGGACRSAACLRGSWMIVFHVLMICCREKKKGGVTSPVVFTALNVFYLCLNVLIKSETLDVLCKRLLGGGRRFWCLFNTPQVCQSRDSNRPSYDTTGLVPRPIT